MRSFLIALPALPKAHQFLMVFHCMESGPLEDSFRVVVALRSTVQFGFVHFVAMNGPNYYK